MALIQSIALEMFVGKDAEPLYTEKGQFIVKFPACWSRGPEEKMQAACTNSRAACLKYPADNRIAPLV